MDENQSRLPLSESRPVSVTILALGVLSIAGLNFVRLLLSIIQWKFLASLPQIQPLYLLLTGLIWSSACLTIAWGLWRGLSWAPRFTMAVVLTYLFYYWMDRIFLVDQMEHLSTSSRLVLPANWLIAACITFIVMVYTVWTLRRPKAMAFFGESYER